MNTKNFASFALSFFLSAVPSFCYAGAEGHAGGAFVCRDADYNIRNIPLAIEFVDIWEGIHIFKLNIRRSDEPVTKQKERALSRLRYWYPELYDMALPSILNNDVAMTTSPPIDPDSQIALPSDLRSSLVKRNCPPEGLASYTDDNENISLNYEVLNAVDSSGEKIMSNTDVAAFHIHEAVCRAFRTFWKDENTSRCRRAVAFLFSDEFIPKWSNPKEPYLTWNCESPTKLFLFNIYEPTKNSSYLNFQFINIDGNRMMMDMYTRVSFPQIRAALDEIPMQPFSIIMGKVRVPQTSTIEPIYEEVRGPFDNYFLSFIIGPGKIGEPIRCQLSRY